MRSIFLILCLTVILSCKSKTKVATGSARTDSAKTSDAAIKDSIINYDTVTNTILTHEVNTGNVFADSVVSYAESLIGTPYKYASIDPAQGFDCSGFITYVFTHFGISVPRSSKDFENVGDPVSLFAAKRGDLILFTGTDSTIKTIGHMGIITENNGGEINFVHSSSGKANGVTISPVGPGYMARYVKTVRVFNQ